MRLVRNNSEDARVMRDLEMLARELGPEDGRSSLAVLEAPAVADEAAPVAAAAAAGAEPLTAEQALLEDPFVRGFVKVTTHVRSFIAYYLGAALWLAVMLLMSPVGDQAGTGDEIADPFAGGGAELASGETVESALPDSIAAPFADIGATPADSGGGFAFSPSEDTSSFDSSSSDFASGAFATDTSFEDEAVADEPQPLRIIRSGYASRTAGTPLEQEPPGGGLPVASSGVATKQSYIALSGDETVLRLKVVDDPTNVGAESAGVMACVITTADWKAERGQSMEGAPAFGPPCAIGTRGDDGVWTFDLGKAEISDPAGVPGLALVPRGAGPLNLTFDKTAVTAG